MITYLLINLLQTIIYWLINSQPSQIHFVPSFTIMSFATGTLKIFRKCHKSNISCKTKRALVSSYVLANKLLKFKISKCIEMLFIG